MRVLQMVFGFALRVAVAVLGGAVILWLLALALPNVQLDNFWSAMLATGIINGIVVVVGMAAEALGRVSRVLSIGLAVVVLPFVIYLADRVVAGFVVSNVWGYVFLTVALGGLAVLMRTGGSIKEHEIAEQMEHEAEEALAEEQRRS